MNAGFEYRAVVGRRDAGRPLVEHLAGCYRHSSPEEWRARIALGRVLVDGRAAAADAILRTGQTIVWMRPPWTEPPAPLAWAVLYRDEELLAVAKPAGLPTVAGGGFLEHTLAAIVRRRHPEAAPAHRLDRGASGIVLFARGARARAGLAESFRRGLVVKEYRALVSGSPVAGRFAITTPIGRVAHPRLGLVHAAARPSGETGAAGGARAARAARTLVEVVERRGATTLLTVRPVTGRPHQIRIHLAAAGLPLAGDPLYGPGGMPRDDAAAAGAGGYLLHATRVELDHPARGFRVRVECAPPPPLRRAGERPDWTE